MKKHLDTALRIFGLLCALWLALYFVGNHFAPSPYERAMKSFGSEEKMKAMKELFDTVKNKGIENPNLTNLETKWYGFAVVKRVSAASLPNAFKGPGEFWEIENTGSMPEAGDVLAYFNTDGSLKGVEFHSSRYGAFISDSPSESPSYYNSLHRIDGNVVGDSDHFISLVTN